MSQDNTQSTTVAATNVSPSVTLTNGILSQDNEPIPHMSSLESLQECARQLIQEINAKRQRDATILSELKTELDNHTTSSFARIEKFILSKSQATSEVIQTKLQILFNTLNHVSELKSELEHFRNDLEVLNCDTQKPGIM
ncbi:hypothetical protein LOD99_1273 [Oopsacas minuta]|uniref:Biogenesis of lysosome-related organelles complex 1 subunit 7 n=1 Tax=Oopsacas minuta TaxID=111878 RepID=A0AAV7K5H8_9METZ|nr:hypothetical protein LOD99_1273 [Oopsacas minuta]